MNIKFSTIFLIFVALNQSSYGAPATEAGSGIGENHKSHHHIKLNKINHSRDNEVDTEKNNVPIENQNEDDEVIYRHRKRQITPETPTTADLIRQIVDSLKTSKNKESDPTYDDIEEVFACTDINNENACSLITDFQLSKKNPTCFDKHLPVSVTLFNQKKDLFLTKDSRMLTSEQESNEECFRLKMLVILCFN